MKRGEDERGYKGGERNGSVSGWDEKPLSKE